MLDGQGRVLVAVYSSGAIGRLTPSDVLGDLSHLREDSQPQLGFNARNRRKVVVMAVHCVAVSGADAEKLVPILHDAEEDDERIRAALRDPSCQTYAAYEADEPVGAAVVRWEDREPSEILYIAVVAARRGTGLGRQIIAAILDELPAHGRTLLVGTANSALDNIAFYQKCGFRMYAVKRDFFDYIQPPLREYGIVMCDMIVFAYDVETE